MRDRRQAGRPILILTLLPILSGSAAEETPRNRKLESLLPSHPGIVVVIADAPGFLESWPGTPLGKTWEDPQVKKFLAPMRESMQLDRWEELIQGETGYEWADILAGFSGSAALAITDLDRFMKEEEPGSDFPAVAVAEVPEGGEVLEGLFRKALASSREEAAEGVQIEDSREEFQGETIHVWRSISGEGEKEINFWAVVDRIAVVAGTRDLLERTVSNIKKGGASPSLEENAGYRAFRNRNASSDLLFFLDAKRFLLPILEGAAEEAERERTKKQEPGTPPPPFHLSVQAVLDALGLDSFHGVGMAARLGESVMQFDMGVTYGEGKGLVQLFDAYTPGPVDLPKFIPDDVLDVNVYNFSFPIFWEAIRGILQGISPEMGSLVDLQLQQLKANGGIDIEGSLFSSLGGQVVMATFRPPGGLPGGERGIEAADRLFGFSLRERQGIELVLEWIKNMAGAAGTAFDGQEFLDQTIYTARAAAPPGEGTESGESPDQGFSYALTADYLFMSTGSTEPIRTVLSRLRKPGRSIWARPEVRSALEAFPDTASAISYQDFASMIRLVFQAFVTMQQLGGDSGEGPEEICDPDELPDKSVLDRYLGVGVGAMIRERGGLFSTFRLHAARK